MSGSVLKCAVISPCGLYRYWLERTWSDEPPLPIIMLNPSTADADIDDRTIGRCVALARRAERGGIVVCNLYALRSTDPKNLRKAEDPIGPENNGYLQDLADMAARTGVPIVCAWGVHASQDRSTYALMLIRSRHATAVCLSLTKHGNPGHPLYLRGDLPFLPFS